MKPRITRVSILIMISILKTHPLLKIASGALYELPTPTNIRAI